MKRKKMVKWIAVLCCVAAFAVLMGCGDETAGPRNITQKYFDAVKSGDIEGAFRCFTPATQQQYGAAMSLGSMIGQGLFGVDGGSLLGGFMSAATQHAYKDCEFIAGEVEFTDEEHEHATVHVTVEGGGEGIPASAEVKTVKYDGEWYLEN